MKCCSCWSGGASTVVVVVARISRVIYNMRSGVRTGLSGGLWELTASITAVVVCAAGNNIGADTRSLTYEPFKYCESLGYDVLSITELWRKQNNYQTDSTRYTTSTPKTIHKGPRKGENHFPDDKAARVGILLSKRARAQKKLLAFGSESERVCWVRLKGSTHVIFSLHTP